MCVYISFNYFLFLSLVSRCSSLASLRERFMLVIFIGRFTSHSFSSNDVLLTKVKSKSNLINFNTSIFQFPNALKKPSRGSELVIGSILLHLQKGKKIPRDLIIFSLQHFVEIFFVWTGLSFVPTVLQSSELTDRLMKFFVFYWRKAAFLYSENLNILYLLHKSNI